MRDTKEVTASAAKRYWRSWRDALLTGATGSTSFNLEPPSASAIVAEPGDIAGWLTAWREYAEQHPDIALRAKVIRTPHGDQPVYTHLDIPDTTALAGLDLDSSIHWQKARGRWVPLQPTTDPQVIRPWLSQIVALNDADFELLLTAAEWFRANPRSGLTIRRVPIRGMHTKWLARHRRLVLALLGHTSHNDSNAAEDSCDIDPADLPTVDLDALGLRPVPPEADVILADPSHRRLLAGLRHIRAPIDELAQLPLRPRHVLVIENKEAALPLGDREGLVIVHSLGNHTDALRQLPWLPQDHTLYWGDLDRHGFTLLSRARTEVPSLRSILMTSEAVDRFHHLAVTETLGRYDLPDPTLDEDETAALRSLDARPKYIRIEQERIPVELVEAAFSNALRHGDAVR